VKDFVEESGLLYEKEVTYNQETKWHTELLRLGIAKLDPQQKNIKLSCNIMRRYYLSAISPSLPSKLYISNICLNPGIIDLFGLVQVLFKHISLKIILMGESWVKSRVNPKYSGPSEKQYQCEFYRILCCMCLASPWSPTFEMNRGGKKKVDLGLVYTISSVKKYQIEIATNVRQTGDNDHSAQGLYTRQCTAYADTDASEAIVVIIYTHPDATYWWPTNDDVKYIVVEHFVETNPNEIKIMWKDHPDQDEIRNNIKKNFNTE